MKCGGVGRSGVEWGGVEWSESKFSVSSNPIWFSLGLNLGPRLTIFQEHHEGCLISSSETYTEIISKEPSGCLLNMNIHVCFVCLLPLYSLFQKNFVYGTPMSRKSPLRGKIVQRLEVLAGETSISRSFNYPGSNKRYQLGIRDQQ